MTNPVEVTQRLEPCPFGCPPEDGAGSTLAVVRAVVSSEGWSVWCDTCGCEGPRCATDAEAIAAWNTRTGDRIAELEAAVTRLTLALEMERGRGQPRAEHDRRFPDLGPSGEVEVEQIVEWLRGQAAIYNDQNPDLSVLPEWTLAQKWANAIERGEHRSAALTPARTYAQGIEDAAKLIADWTEDLSDELIDAIRALGTKP